MFGFKQKQPERKEKTLAEAISDSDGIVINYKKMNETIRKCKEEKENKQCRLQLKEIGVEFLDEIN